MLRAIYGQFKRFLRFLNGESPVDRAVKEADDHYRDIEFRSGVGGGGSSGGGPLAGTPGSRRGSFRNGVTGCPTSALRIPRVTPRRYQRLFRNDCGGGTCGAPLTP